MNLTQNRILIYGAGYYGEMSVKMLRSINAHIDGVIDSSENKIGNQFCGFRVLSPDGIEPSADLIIIISSMKYYDEIFKKLESIGFNKKSIISYDRLIHFVVCSKAIEYRQSIVYPNHGDKTKRVLYDGQIFSIQKRGGISRYFQELIRHISQIEGFYVDFFEGVNVSELEFEVVGQSNINSWYIDNDIYNDIDTRNIINHELLKYYSDTSPSADIYHPTYYFESDICNWEKKVITVYDMIHEEFNLDQRTIEAKKEAIFNSDGIIAISENTKKDILKYYDIDEKKIKVIYLANSLMFPDVTEAVDSFQYILFVGNREGYKNFKTLAKAYAFSRIRGTYKLLCFGGGEFTAEENSLFDDLKVRDGIMWTNGDDRKLASIYSNASLFVYPSLYEGFGLPILEAMYYGIPVLTTFSSSLPEVAGDAAAYFEGSSVEDLKEKIEMILDSNELWTQMSNDGKDREKLFSWKKTAYETVRFYRDILMDKV